jgi:DNA modification methylase
MQLKIEVNSKPMIIHNDCKEAMINLIDHEIQVDSIVTDPPYELGFMGKAWDKTGIAYDVEMWNLCLQLLKPGGHLLSFGGSRTYHRMACAIEDAGFEIRDQIMWIYGSGFPKSLDISKAIDKAAGAKREITGYKPVQYPDSDCWGIANKNSVVGPMHRNIYNKTNCIADKGMLPIYAPSTEEAKQWQGFGTALKPAHEPIVLARKPIDKKTIAQNVLTHGTGAINIDGCRVEGGKRSPGFKNPDAIKEMNGTWNEKNCGLTAYKNCDESQGRFPANLIHDGSDEVIESFPKASGAQGIVKGNEPSKNILNVFGGYKCGRKESIPRNESDKTASRFFYCAKASKKERQGSKHPTVKPLALMRYLCRLITPPNGVVLDPFAGTGTTGHAAILEGFESILIEREAQYISDIEKRCYG